jgi:hypothetical protein
MSSEITGCPSGVFGNLIASGRWALNVALPIWSLIVVVDRRIEQQSAHLHAIRVDRSDEITVDRVLVWRRLPDAWHVLLQELEGLIRRIEAVCPALIGTQSQRFEPKCLTLEQLIELRQ